ncbi:hypothetical protein POLEWNIK_00390 [Brevundimonas phage vB_BpoS-Polewnik]|nr:hypothetical protein POLEWNIK_00390 [Brevundimonas phage vB_BpoS-Polewnik]
MSTEEVPIRELLRRLNNLRTDVGKPELASWKGSRANLVNAIDTVKAEAEAALEARLAAVENGPSVLEGHPLHTEAKALDAAKKPKPPKPQGDTFTLSELAADLDIQPKIARAKARRNKDKLAGYMTGDEGWHFLTKYRSEVAKLIK